MLVLSLSVIFATSVKAYVLYDHSWPSATTTFNVDIPGADGKWNTAFEQAMERWNVATIFEFKIRRVTFESPCDGLPVGTSDGDFENGVGFVSDVCGDAFGENTLATTGAWARGTRLLQSNIFFNNAYPWDVYDAPYGIGQWVENKPPVDFRRLAVHELGHALGLGHEDNVPAIMVTNQSLFSTPILVPQVDDIAGVAARYSTASIPSAPFLLSPSNGAAGISLTPLLDWLASANADSYDVHFGTSSNPAFARNLVRSSYSPGPLDPNTTYYWRVAARSSSGTSSSATYRFTTIDSSSGQPTQPRPNGNAFMIFPQVADGAFSDGAFYRTTISLIHKLGGDATCSLTLYGMDVDFGLGRDSSFTWTIPVDGFVSARTTGDGPIQTGYAVVSCDEAVYGQLTYASYAASGTKSAEATVFPAEVEFSSYDIIVDGRDGSGLGLAIANNTDLARTYDLTLRDRAGSRMSMGSVPVPARSNVAQFLNDLISPPPAPGNVYLLEVRASDSSVFSMIGLRFTGAAFSTVPAN